MPFHACSSSMRSVLSLVSAELDQFSTRRSARQECETIGERELTDHLLKTSGDAVMLLMEVAHQRLVSGHDDFCPKHLMLGIHTKRAVGENHAVFTAEAEI